MRTAHCPICQLPFDLEHSVAPPFCSPRCRQIDLGRWLGENYSVPVAPRDEEDEESQAVGDDAAD